MSQGKKEPKLTHIKESQKTQGLSRPQVAQSCLCARVGRAKLLPGRDRKSSLCTFGGDLLEKFSAWIWMEWRV